MRCTVGRRRSASISSTRFVIRLAERQREIDRGQALAFARQRARGHDHLDARARSARGAASRPACGTARARAGENPSVPSSLPTSCGSVRHARSSLSPRSAATSSGVIGPAAAGRGIGGGRGCTADCADRGRRRRRVSWRGAGSATAAAGSRSGVRFARSRASASRVIRIVPRACRPNQGTPARLGARSAGHRRNRSRGTLRGPPPDRPAVVEREAGDQRVVAITLIVRGMPADRSWIVVDRVRR